MSVFLSTLDVDIHDGFFKELWHIALVVEPTRREAGFFIWNKKSLELAKGYRVAYPPSLPEKQRWIYPELRSSSFVHGSDFSIQSFYEPGCWHTRYYDGDKLIVKVRKSAVEDFEKMSKGQSSISRFGICLGHTSINPSSVGPEYLFEITQLRLLEESGMASLAEQLFNLPKRDSLQVMGLCMIVPKSLSANLFDNKEISILQHRPDFATLVYIMGTSDGLETCVWFDKSGRFVQRDLVELASITETAEMELVELLADIKRRTPDGNA